MWRDLAILLGFGVSTGFALSVDVGLYAVARFATARRRPHVGRFAFEVALAHAILLALGAGITVFVADVLGNDLVVDLAAAAALAVVVLAAVRRARDGHLEDDAALGDPGASFALFTAFALSLDALLVAPGADEFLNRAAPGSRPLALALVFLAVFGFAAIYAASAARLREVLFAGSNGAPRPGWILATAMMVELCVFSTFLTDAVARAMEHLADERLSALATVLAGVTVGLSLFAVARLTRRRGAAVESPS
jgi:hypothetical protein